MALTSILSTSTAGLQAASLRVQSAADNIVNINTEGYRASRVSQSTLVSGSSGVSAATSVNAQLIGSDQAPELATEVIRLIEAEVTYRANASVIRTTEDLARDTVDLIA